MKPKDLASSFPFDSCFNHCEHEIVAQNIMCILGRTGNEFRPLTWDEYKTERLKDKNFSESEKFYFDEVIDYCKSEDTIILFSIAWKP